MPTDMQKARELFLHAVGKLPPEQWDGYIVGACRGDADLQQQAAYLLQIHREAGSFLAAPAPSLGLSPTIDQPLLERTGSLIGCYKLLQQIGEGGMGTVFMAEQMQPVQRKVALKLIKAGMDSRQVTARFEAERQALAMMDHVNIARVLDAGTTETGRPYFVMELVHGVPITKYCDDNHLTPRERLELFVPVCQAIQHAHQKGIIHRDIKPSNVMITLYDGKPVPKVIDFGVAKATEQNLTERTLFTQYGTLVGTLEYMSPEQAEMSALGVDTRSDIFSLGVLLYELLTGSTPLSRKRVREAVYGEVLRMIKEEEPPKPSTRLTDSGEALASISANRHMDPAKLTKLVRGELDWIVMKCLEKDRNRRYETAKDFAADVQRYLTDEPVQACPPSALYRFRKFARRNKAGLATAGLVLAAILAGMAGTTWGMFRAEHARQDAVSAQFAEAERAEGERRAKEEAQKRLAQIEMGTEVLASVFRDLDPKAGEKEGVTLRVLLGRRLGEAVRQLDGEAVGDPLVVARLQHLLAISLRELGHLEQAEAALDQACRTRERLLGPDHLDTAASKHNLAQLYRAQGKYPQAEELYKEVLEVRTAQLGADHDDTLSSKNNLALVYMSRAKYAESEPLLREVLAVRTARFGADDPKTLQSKHNLAGLYVEQQKYAQAEALYKEVLEGRSTKLRPGHPDTLQTKNNLAGLYAVMQEKYAQAEALLIEVLDASVAELGPGNPFTLTSKHNLAMLYHKQGKYDPAEKLLKEVLEVQTATLEAGHPDTIQSKRNLAGLYGHMKKYDQSIPLFEETLERSKAILSPDHPQTLTTQVNLAINYRETGRFAEAISLLEDVHRKGNKYSDQAWVGRALLTAYVRAGKTTEATALVAEQVRAARDQFPADSLQLATALTTAGQALLEAKSFTDAEPLLRESLSLREKQTPAAWDTYNARSQVGGALLGQRNYPDAEPLLLTGYTGLRQTEAQIPPQVKDVRLRDALERLVQLYDDWGKPEEAAKWRKELESRKDPAILNDN